jgi:hypothetical protein
MFLSSLEARGIRCGFPDKTTVRHDAPCLGRESGTGHRTDRHGRIRGGWPCVIPTHSLALTTVNGARVRPPLLTSHARCDRLKPITGTTEVVTDPTGICSIFSHLLNLCNLPEVSLPSVGLAAQERRNVQVIEARLGILRRRRGFRTAVTDHHVRLRIVDHLVAGAGT